MKKLLRRAFIPVFLSVAILPVSSAFAAGDWRGFHPNQLVITQETPLYDGQPPGLGAGTLTPTGAALAPQVVNCTSGWNGQYYEVETWIGTKWVKASDRIYGKNTTPARIKYRVNEIMYLYDEPFTDKKTYFAIAPQDVESLDSSDVGNQAYLKIKTWVGDKWLKLGDSLTSVRAIQKWDDQTGSWVDMPDPTKPQ